MKRSVKILCSVLLICILFTLGACTNMHKGPPPSDHPSMDAAGSNPPPDASGQSCHDGAGPHAGCDCAHDKGAEHDCHHECHHCMECAGCKEHKDCGMHDKNQKHECMNGKKGGCDGDGCGHCKEAGCGHCAAAAGQCNGQAPAKPDKK
jgi:hypothetical protein